MGKNKVNTKKSPSTRKKFDLREFGNAVRKFFRKVPHIKPINSFEKSGMAQSYKKWYLKNEQNPLEIKVRMVEDRYDSKRPMIDDRVKRSRRRITPYKRSHSGTRTVHDTEEFVEEMYNIYSAMYEMYDPYPFDGNMNYPSPPGHKTIQANFSQQDIPKMTRKSRHLNEQCTSMAYTAVVVAKNLPTTLWTPEMMDRLLVYGDRLHHRSMDDLKWKRRDSGSLCVDQLQILPHTTRSEWPVKVLPTKLLHGLICPEFQGERDGLKMTNGLSLQNAVRECFSTAANGCVLTISDFSTAIIRDPIDRPCVFDSHKNNTVGRDSIMGKASLYKFDTIEHVVDYYSKKHGASAEFNIAGLEVLKRSIPKVPEE